MSAVSEGRSIQLQPSSSKVFMTFYVAFILLITHFFLHFYMSEGTLRSQGLVTLVKC